MTTKELIRAEVKRLFEKYQESERQASKYCDSCANEDIAFYQGKRKVCSEILSYLDALPDESEQPTRGYDEAFLNEKIAKASKTLSLLSNPVSTRSWAMHNRIRFCGWNYKN